MPFPKDAATFLLGTDNQILSVTFSGSPDIRNHLSQRKSNTLYRKVKEDNKLNKNIKNMRYVKIYILEKKW